MAITRDSSLICGKCDKFLNKSCENLTSIFPMLLNIQKNPDFLIKIDMIRCNKLKIEGKINGDLIRMVEEKTEQVVVENDF